MMNDIDQAERAVREVLQKAYGQDAVRGDEAFVKAGMSVKELVRMYALIREHDCRSAVEVGMGSGTSSVVICKGAARKRRWVPHLHRPISKHPEGGV